MSNIIPFDKTQLPSRLVGEVDNDDLSANISGGFGVLGFRGSKWRIRYAKEDTLVTDADGDPKPAIELIMVKASPYVSKNFFAKGYTEGVSEAPDCFSMNGETPDKSVKAPQHSICATCPQNQFGSRISDAGKESKACSDSRRIAVVPAGDIGNETFGGPMLLRVPVMSLVDLGIYGKKMKEKQFPYNTVVTKLGFDGTVSYPKLTYKAVRPITDDEADEVIALDSSQISSILHENFEFNKNDEATDKSGTVDTEFEEPPKPKKATRKKRAKKVVDAEVPTPTPTDPAPEAPAGGDSELDAELDSILEGMGDLG